jgi:hypothetical protein
MARRSRRSEREAGAATRENLGFLLAKASQRWNELLHQRFAAAGYPEVRPLYGSIPLPLFEEGTAANVEDYAGSRASRMAVPQSPQVEP